MSADCSTGLSCRIKQRRLARGKDKLRPVSGQLSRNLETDSGGGARDDYNVVSKVVHLAPKLGGASKNASDFSALSAFPWRQLFLLPASRARSVALRPAELQQPG